MEKVPSPRAAGPRRAERARRQAIAGASRSRLHGFERTAVVGWSTMRAHRVRPAEVLRSE